MKTTTTGYWYLILLLFSLSCITDPQQSESDLKILTQPAGKRFVAYLSPDRIEKPDSVKLTVSFSGFSLDKITAEATIDSGANWFPLPAPVADGKTGGTLLWSPRLDSARFDYFGEKQCVIRVLSVEANLTDESDPLVIIGTVPVINTAPVPGDTFQITDTIPISYLVNSDRISNIRTFFRTDSSAQWIEISGTATRIDGLPSPFKSFSIRFSPAPYDTLFSTLPGNSVEFLLKDYFSPLPNNSIIINGIIIN